jgi:hypothetical protein
MALKPAKDKAIELMNLYYDSIRKECISKPNGNIFELAQKFTENHCDEMISFIDSEMQGWLDWDMKAYFEEVKKHSKSLIPKE